MSAPIPNAADELLALVNSTPVVAEETVTSQGPPNLDTRHVAQSLKLHPRELYALAARLGLVPGTEITVSSSGKPIFRRLWERAWLDELRDGLEAGAGIDIADLCGLP
jgi:hypothetical protein